MQICLSRKRYCALTPLKEFRLVHWRRRSNVRRKIINCHAWFTLVVLARLASWCIYVVTVWTLRWISRSIKVGKSKVPGSSPSSHLWVCYSRSSMTSSRLTWFEGVWLNFENILEFWADGGFWNNQVPVTSKEKMDLNTWQGETRRVTQALCMVSVDGSWRSNAINNIRIWSHSKDLPEHFLNATRNPEIHWRATTESQPSSAFPRINSLRPPIPREQQPPKNHQLPKINSQLLLASKSINLPKSRPNPKRTRSAFRDASTA